MKEILDVEVRPPPPRAETSKNLLHSVEAGRMPTA